MSVPNNSRASDLGAILTTGTTGFTVRKRTGIGLFFHFFILACMVMLGVSLLVYYKSPEGSVLAVAIGLALALIAQNLEKQKKKTEALEFMNALFSSAIGKGYAFCCMVKSTGEIVFYNRPFQEVFPNYVAQKTRTLKSLTELYHVPQEHADALKALMEENRAGEIASRIHAENQPEKAVTFHLEPIERPTGFFLLRGQ